MVPMPGQYDKKAANAVSKNRPKFNAWLLCKRKKNSFNLYAYARKSGPFLMKRISNTLTSFLDDTMSYVLFY